MKKIILTLWRDSPGGIEVLLPDIITNCNNYLLNVFILREKAKDNSIFDGFEAKVHYGSNKNLKLYFHLFKFGFKNRHQIFHVFNVGPIILLILKIAGVKRIIYSIHGTIYWRTKFQQFFRKLIWLFAIDEKIFFIANSHWSRRKFLEQISSKPYIEVVYNPINLKRFNFKNNKKYPKKIIYAGRLASGKNLYRWLECAKQIFTVLNNTSFIIYGDGPLKCDLENYAKQLNIADIITFYGFKKDIENAYKESDLLLFLSEYESFGNVAVESILCGTPVIVSKIPPMEEIFINYPEFLVTLDENLEKNIINKLLNYEELKRSSSMAAEEFKQRFSLAKHISELQRVYNRFEK